MPWIRKIPLSDVEEIVGGRYIAFSVDKAGNDVHVDYRSKEKERKESSDPDAPTENEQDLSSHTSAVGSVIYGLGEHG